MDMNFWKNAGRGEKMGVVLGSALILGATIGGFAWLANERYAVLFGDLEAADAGRVVSELERIKREYKISDDGRSILVPESEVHEARLKLMSSGMPLAGGVGFEVFDDAGFGMTEFVQRINYQRALEGELTRTIMALKEVKYARVHLVMPEGGLFKSEADKASAAVTLFLKSGMQPDALQIAGVQRLVAAAVPRLQSEQVTVTDQSGVTLSRNGSDASGVEAVSTRLEKKIELEKYLVAKVNDVLSKAFGPNQAMVSVDVTLDMDKRSTTTESVVPNAAGEGMLRRRESQVGGAKDKSAAGASVTTETEYQLGHSVEQKEEMPGRIIRLGVGVVVPAETGEERRAAIRDLVAVTVGFDGARGDAMAVYSLAAPVGTATGVVTASEGGVETGVLGADAGALDPPPPAVSFMDQLSASALGREPWMIGLGGLTALAALMLVVLIWNATRRPWGPQSPRRLSAPEREQMLQQINNWLGGAEPSQRGKAGT